jgi:endonuclease I
VINGFLMKNDICVISRLYIGERHTIATHDNKKPIVNKYRKTKHVVGERERERERRINNAREWVSDFCFTPTQHFFSYIMTITS